jgi:hypothetical protein
MEEIEYVKIDKSFLLKQWNFLNDKILEIEKLPFDDNHPTNELQKLRGSFQDLSFIISKTQPL